MTTLAGQPWWTEADQAEFDLLLLEFVKAALRHREGCAICRGGGPWCDPLYEAFEILVDWRDCRILQSKADWLRLRQELHHAA